MFSMSALPSFPPVPGTPTLDAAALARLGVLQGTESLLSSRPVLGLGWPELERILPDHGLPCGVVEIAALPVTSSVARSRAELRPESMAGGGTSIAIAAIAAVHAKDPAAWCAWITPEDAPDATSGPGGGETPRLYAPALAQANVDLDRLLIVRPPPAALARTAVKVAASGAFAIMVVDVPHPQDLGTRVVRGISRVEPGSFTSQTSQKTSQAGRPAARSTGLERAALVVRKLALAAEETGTTSVLLTSARARAEARAAPWPVALRIEVERRPEALAVRIAKDRLKNRFSASGSSQHVVRLAS